MAAFTPIIRTAVGAMVWQHATHSMAKQFGEPHFKAADMTIDCADLKKLVEGSDGSLVPSCR